MDTYITRRIDESISIHDYDDDEATYSGGCDTDTSKSKYEIFDVTTTDEDLVDNNVEVVTQPTAANNKPYIYTYDGVKVEFPYEAYQSQIQMMRKIVTGVKNCQNCLLESPTGTGKTAALLCAILAWQREAASQGPTFWDQTPYIEPCTCGFDSDNDVTDGVSKLHIEMVKSKGDFFLKKSGTNFQAETADSKSPKKSKVEIVETTPFSKLCRGCRSKYFHETRLPRIYYATRTHTQIKQVVDQLKKTNYASAKMTILSSRTHTCQAFDVQDEVKNKNGNYDEECEKRRKTYWKIDKKINAANKPVESRTSGMNPFNQLLEITSKTVLPEINTSKINSITFETRDLLTCPYYGKKNEFLHVYRNYGAQRGDAWDIEDLNLYAKKAKLCSFYGSRVLQEDADVIFLPYNYLFSPFLTKSANIQLQNSVVILDEAHNIESYCIEAASKSISMVDLLRTIEAFDHVANNVRCDNTPVELIKMYKIYTTSFKCLENYILTQTNKDNTNQIITPESSAANTPKSTVSNSRSSYNSSITPTSSLSLNASSRLSRHGITPKSCLNGTKFNKTFAYPSPTKFNSSSTCFTPTNTTSPSSFRNESTVEIQIQLNSKELIDAFTSFGFGKDTIVQHVKNLEYMDGEDNEVPSALKVDSLGLRFLKNLISTLKFLYADSTNLNDYTAVLEKKFESPSSSSSLATPNNSYLIRRKNPTYTFQIICLNPSIAFRELKESCRSIIVASGTLFPMESFESELDTKFAQQLSGPHAISRKDNRIWCGNITKSHQHPSLNFKLTQSNQNDFFVQDELGAMVFRISQLVPHGVLVFVTSYTLLDKLRKRWTEYPENHSLINKLNLVKNVFFEDPLNNKDIVNNYRRHIEANPAGAILFAVHRGKISEGVDFRDNQARAVITIGIPYPPVQDPHVIGKRRYNDSKHENDSKFLDGWTWYSTQAFRSMNQSFGRCVRHKKDWGAVIIIDSRIGSSKHKVSKWVRDHYVGEGSDEQILGSLNEFIQERVRLDREEEEKNCNMEVSLPILNGSNSNHDANAMAIVNVNNLPIPSQVLNQFR